MKTGRFVQQGLVAVVLVLMLATGVWAGTVTKNGITLTYPDYPLTGPGLQSCEPWNEPIADKVTLTGVPEGATVIATTAFANPYTGSPTYQPPDVFPNVTGGTLEILINYPTDTTIWPVFDENTNERAISVAVMIQVVAADGTVTKLVGKQWWVRCVPPLPPFQGCTPGYWRQDQHFDSWVATGYAPSDDFEAVFGVDASFDPHTLLDAVWLNGGGENALARHAVAALLNASSPDVNYFFTAAQVIAGVQNAYATGDFEDFKDDLDFANNASCPLD